MSMKLATPTARPAARIAPGADLDVKILVRSAGQPARILRVDEEEFVIGRNEGCHLRIDNERVSHRHCRIRRTGNGRVVLEDLNSMQGTLVNDQPVRKADIRDGDRLRIGPTLIVFRIVEAAQDRKSSGGSWLDGNPLAAMAPRAFVPERAEVAADASSLAATARRLLDRMARDHAPDEPRPVIEIAEDDGVAVVRVLSTSIVEEEDIRRIAQELRDLIASGRACIALVLKQVEELSIQAVALLIEARDQCWSAGGLLMLCEPRPPVAQTLAALPRSNQFEIVADEASALDAPWPGLTRRPRLAGPPQAPAPASAPSSTRACLIAMFGRARGKAIELGPDAFRIGRDPSCHLRPASPAIGLLHAILERRGERFIVRDLGARNGTRVNGFLIRGTESSMGNGDRLQIGPLFFVLVLGDRDPIAAIEEADDSCFIPVDDDEATPEPDATAMSTLPMLRPARSFSARANARPSTLF